MEKVEKKKSHVVLTTILVILLLIAFTAFGYFLGGANIINDVRENNSKNNSGEMATPEEKESSNAKDFSKDEAKKLLEYFGFNKNVSCGQTIYNYFYSEDYRMIIAAEKVKDEKKNEMSCSELYNESVKDDDMGYKGSNGYCLDKTRVISYNDFNEVYKSMYGKDAAKKDVNGIGFIYSYYEYSKERDAFIGLNCGACGGTCGPNGFNINEIKSAKVIGDYLYIDVNYYYSQPTDRFFVLDTNRIYRSLETSSEEEAKNKILSDYMDYLDVYEVVFKKVDNNYVFVSFSQLLS